MAINTYKTYLMKGTGSGSSTTYEKLIDIKDFPDLGSAPPTLDTTTLSDAMHTYIEDIMDTGGGLEFNANYTKADYSTLEALKGTTCKFAVWFGASESGGVVTPDGSDGKFSFEGQLSVWKKGAGVSAVQEMGISIAPSTPITFS
jgi:hypothetical protein